MRVAVFALMLAILGTDPRVSAHSYQVDILMLGDHSLFESFQLLNPRQPIRYAHLYLEAIFTQIAAIYSRLRVFGSQKVDLRLVGVLVIDRETDCPMKMGMWKDLLKSGNRTWPRVLKYDYVKAMHHLDNWQRAYLTRFSPRAIPSHDHIILLTKFDLTALHSGSGTLGVAQLNSMCQESSFSLVEDLGGLMTSKIAAHELAHSLGADHDGRGARYRRCPVNANYLMAPYQMSWIDEKIFDNAFVFSQCSIEGIESFLATEESTCLNKEKPVPRPLGDQLMEVVLSLKKRRVKDWRPPGVHFDVVMQCKLAFGPKAKPCLNMGDEGPLDVCQQLWCTNGSTPEHCMTKLLLPLMNGTPCGLGTICFNGRCRSPAAIVSSTAFVCRRNANEGYCRSFTPTQLQSKCRHKQFAETCCVLCRTISANWFKFRHSRRLLKLFG